MSEASAYVDGTPGIEAHRRPPEPGIGPGRGPDGGRFYGAVTFALRPGFRGLLLDLTVPAGPAPAPVVIWLHGGAFLFGDRRFLPDTLRPGSVPQALLDAGIAVAVVDYRLSGEAKFPAQLDDVLAAWQYLHLYRDELNIDTSRFGIWGESAGGLLAALAALSVPPQAPEWAAKAAVCWYPPTELLAADLSPDATDSPEALLLGGPPASLPALATRASAVANVRADAPPFLLVHGEADTAIPVRQSLALHEALLAVGASSALHVVPGADHCLAGYSDPDALIAESVSFLAGHLGAGGAGQGG